MHTPPSFTSHQFVPSHRHTLMSTVRCLEVKTFGKNKDAAGSGTDDYSTVETSFQPSAGTAAESFDLLCSLPLLLSYCFSPYKKEEGVSVSTTNSQLVTIAPPQVFLASPGESVLFHQSSFICCAAQQLPPRRLLYLGGTSAQFVLDQLNTASLQRGHPTLQQSVDKAEANITL